MKANRTRWLIGLLAIFGLFSGYAQVFDDFLDGNFTDSPTWGGTESDFIVNANKQLQLNATAPGTSYLSTPHNLSDFDNREWGCWINQKFAGSSVSFGRYYLTSVYDDLSTDPDGIYLQLGESGNTDAVRLMQRIGGVSTQICASVDGSIKNSFAIRLRIVRKNTGMWSLFIDFSGGDNLLMIAQGQETALPTGTHLGYRCTYSTTNNATRFYLDDVYADDEVPDTDPPIMTAIDVVEDTKINILFSEPIEALSAENTSNYTIYPPIAISSATINSSNPFLVNLQLASALVNGVFYTLTLTDIADLNGNIANSQAKDFVYLIADTPTPGDVIINEFMADPTPVVGLPEVEFVELYNRSNKVFDISGWKLGDNATFGTIQPSNPAWLLPGGYAILCPTNAVSEFENAIGVVSFPSLNNNTDDIAIVDDMGVELDRLTYTLDWYQDETKKDGGWTIERINPLAPCSDVSNWKASVHPNGGTPGEKNSVYDTTPDTSTPLISTIVVPQAHEVEIQFNKAMKPASLLNASITTQPALTESSRNIDPIPSSTFSVFFTQEITPTTPYTITISSVQDCWGNVGNLTSEFARSAYADSGDVVLNELLFDQYTGGSDWIELYNNSSKLIDLKDWKFARLNNNNDTVDHKTIDKHYLLHPNDYVVIGGDSTFVLNYYPSAVSGKFYQLSLPSMGNETGSIIVFYPFVSNLDTVEKVMDMVVYSSKWHFELLNDKDGKALERLDPNRPTQDANNWHSAAETVGFATPGRKNSQYYPALYNGKVHLLSDVFSPDNDGLDDILQINYQMNAPEMLASIRIFDDRGRMIKTLAQNQLIGLNGSITWDGIRENGQKVAIGTYVVLFEAFNSKDGNEFIAKKVFTVAGKL